MVDVQHALDGLGRLVPRLLLRALLLSVTLRMLGTGLLRLRLRHAVRVLGHALGRRLPFRGRLLRGRAFGLREFLGTGFLPLVVLDVDDAALCVERSGQALPLTALAATSASAPPVTPEAPASSSASACASAPASLAFSSLPELAVSVQPGLRVTGVARLRRIG
ncbi:MAG TPA: hypothetical protein VIH41_10790 [Myxococcales bacterium]